MIFCILSMASVTRLDFSGSGSPINSPNGWRYPLVGGTRQRRFGGTSLEPRKLLENAQTPTSRVHAVLGSLLRLTNIMT